MCPSSPPHDPAHTVGLNSRIPPTPVHDLTPVPASVPASTCTTYPWEELPLKKCPNIELNIKTIRSIDDVMESHYIDDVTNKDTNAESI